MFEEYKGSLEKITIALAVLAFCNGIQGVSGINAISRIIGFIVIAIEICYISSYITGVLGSVLK